MDEANQNIESRALTLGASWDSKEKMLKRPCRAMKSSLQLDSIVTEAANRLAISRVDADAFGRTIHGITWYRCK